VEREQDPRAVARDAVGRPGAAVGDRREPGERAIEKLPRRAAVGVRHEADAAGVAFEGLVVEERRACQGRRLSGRARAWCRVFRRCLSASRRRREKSPTSGRAGR
jgi:hypothetical protein